MDDKIPDEEKTRRLMILNESSALYRSAAIPN